MTECDCLKGCNVIVCCILGLLNTAMLVVLILPQVGVDLGDSSAALEMSGQRGSLSTVHIMIFVLTVVTFVTLVSCFGTCAENRIALYISMALLILTALGVFGIVAYLFIGMREYFTHQHFYQHVRNYTDLDVAGKLYVDQIEKAYDCCGCNGTIDYIEFDMPFSKGCNATVEKFKDDVTKIKGCCPRLDEAKVAASSIFGSVICVLAFLYLIAGIMSGVVAGTSINNPDATKGIDAGSVGGHRRFSFRRRSERKSSSLRDQNKSGVDGHP